MGEEYKEKMHSMEIKMVKMGEDISHIKGRIDNGLSNTIATINDKLSSLILKITGNPFMDEKLQPKIEDLKQNTRFRKFFEWAGGLIVVGVIGRVLWVLSTFLPHAAK